MTFINLFPCCTITKGYNQSCIIDFERNLYCIIPNELNNYVKEKIDVDNILISNEIDNFLRQNIIYLLAEKFIFTSDTKLAVESLEKEIFESPFIIEDLIIDINLSSDLNDILCNIKFEPETIQIRIFDIITKFWLLEIISLLYENQFYNIELVFNHNELITKEEYIEIITNYQYINRIVVMGYFINSSELAQSLIFNKKKLIDSNQCGIINEKYFSVNIRNVLTSKSCNTCLNKKIAIDINGKVKNCPSFQYDFGDYKDIDIKKILIDEEFTKVWKITKDDVLVCNQCEYREVCSDCRAIVSDDKNILSKPLKCGYNPFINKWNYENGYKTMEECGITFNNEKIFIDHEKIAKINSELWSEEEIND